MTRIRTALLLLIALTATGCTIPLRPVRNDTTPPGSDALDMRLQRCSMLGSRNVDDPDCQSAFAEARKRILPPPMGK